MLMRPWLRVKIFMRLQLLLVRLRLHHSRKLPSSLGAVTFKKNFSPKGTNGGNVGGEDVRGVDTRMQQLHIQHLENNKKMFLDLGTFNIRELDTDSHLAPSSHFKN
jgi:hypothetical protein